MGESDWVSAHAFYHGDLDHLLTHAVAALVDELAGAGAVQGWFFLRYWERGPHLRLRILPDHGRRTEVEKVVTERLLRYLRTHPSPDRMRQDQYAALARTLARVEQRDAYAERLHPHNTVSFIPYRREHDRFGDGASIEAVERHFVESSRIALRVLTMGTSPDQRATVACAAILSTWLVWEPDPRRLVESIGDAGWGKTGPVDLLGIDGGVDVASVERQRERAVEIARRVSRLVAMAHDAPDTGTFIDWARSVTALRDSLARPAAAGASVPPVLPTLDICAHLFCNRLGLPLDAEDVVRTRAVEALEALATEGLRRRRGGVREVA